MLEKIYWRFIEGLVKRNQLNRLVGLVTDYMVIAKADKLLVQVKTFDRDDCEYYYGEVILHAADHSGGELNDKFDEIIERIFKAVKEKQK